MEMRLRRLTARLLLGLCVPLATTAFTAPAHASEPEDVARFVAGRSCFRCDLRYHSAVRVDLPRADLRGAYMFNINLSGARLLDARLLRADLTGANLSNADLRHADLSGAELGSAVLEGARTCGAVFPDGNRAKPC